MLPRFYCPFPLHPGATVSLPDDAAHHALKVLKVGAGETAIVFDGRGGQWTATLQPHGKHLHATLQAFDDRECEAPLRITLAQGIPAADKMDSVVQKAVELGVSAIQPVAAKRSVVRLSGERMERRVAHWNGVAVAACEQSGRNRVPGVAPILDLPHYLGAAGAQNSVRLICLPSAGQRLSQLAVPLQLVVPPQQVVLLIGPEGGFEEGEVRAALAAGFVAVSLGPRVLRTETAGPAALASIMALWGDG